ncbi:hypothetical protein [Caldiplasma sukawensis]
MSRNFQEYVANFLILLPTTVSFFYVLPQVFPYWNSIWYLIIALPLLKFFMPSSIKENYYKIVISLIMLYILISLALKYFNLQNPIFNFNVTYFLSTETEFTIYSSISFIFIIEGIRAKKTKSAVSLNIAGTITSVYSLLVSTVAAISDTTFLTAFYYSGILIIYNIYLLFTQGYEFLTLIIKPQLTVTIILGFTFLLSIFGTFWSLHMSSEKKEKRVSFEDLSYPIIYGSIGAFIFSLLLYYLTITFYSFLVTVVVIMGIIIYALRKDKKEKYDVTIWKEDE